MNPWLQQVINRAQAIDNSLNAARFESIEQLSKAKWPDRRVENWKYTSLEPLENIENLTSNVTTNIAHTSVDVIDNLNSIDVVFVNGKLQTDIKKLKLPNGLTIVNLTNASTAQQQMATSLFSTIKPKRHFFGLVNDALTQDCLLIDIEAQCTISQPIRIVNLVSDNIESHHRLLVRVGEHASVTVIEQDTCEHLSFNTAYSEYDIADNASLEHYRLAMNTNQAMHIGGCHFSLKTHAKLNSTLIGYGSQLSRIDTDIIHNGEHAKAKFNAIYLLAEGENFDLQSTIEHAVPNGLTEENARGIIGNKAKAVFNGRIHIHRNAQKTEANLNNRNLLLSNRGQINSKPELEIYADDVKCSHGATVSEIDDETLYYLRSRAISRSQALMMMNFSFIQTLIEEMPNQHLANWLQPQLKARFLAMEVK
jgi:Fe-S cluster assembly protein SufD